MYFEIYQTQVNALSGLFGAGAGVRGGEWRWRLKAANHQVIASGEGYHNQQDCLHAIELVRGVNAHTAIKAVNA